MLAISYLIILSSLIETASAPANFKAFAIINKSSELILLDLSSISESINIESSYVLPLDAFLSNKTHLRDEVMELEDSLHILQSKSVNLIATQMAENSFEEKERSNYFIYLFRVIKAFERIGDICIEIMDVAIEFHDNIPRSTTPRTFR